MPANLNNGTVKEKKEMQDLWPGFMVSVSETVPKFDIVSGLTLLRE